jgi:hypothetical protein
MPISSNLLGVIGDGLLFFRMKCELNVLVLRKPPSWPVEVLGEETHDRTSAYRVSGQWLETPKTWVALLISLLPLHHNMIIILDCFPQPAQ